MNHRSEVCGDVPLIPAQRARYVRAGLEEIFRSLKDRPRARPYVCRRIVAASHAEIESAASPLRVYTNQCLRQYIPRYCPAEAEVVDIGCGNGQHVRLFDRAGIKGTYIGIDLQAGSGWDDLRDEPGATMKREFVIARAEDLSLDHRRADFSLSSSALEHIENDRDAVKALFAQTVLGGYGIHIVPAAWSLFLYGYHGWRKYSSSRLRGMFEDAGFEVADLLSLGGLPSYLLHLVWISILETGMATTIVFDLATRGGRREGLRNRLLRFVFPAFRTSLRPKKIYVFLLGLVLRLDRFLPWPAHGYVIIVRRPT